MEAALRLKATVMPGNRITVKSPDLRPGDDVEVIVLMPPPDGQNRRSAVDILRDAPGHLGFTTADEVAAYLTQEHAAWDR